VSPDDIAQIQYTSGTTGFPKGAQLTHRGLANNARFYANVIGANAEDVWVIVALYHSHAAARPQSAMVVSIVGVPGAEWGEVVVAFVQPRPGCNLSSEELAEFCRARLASYKTPRIWRFVDRFPQTASGKIQKFVLRDEFIASTG
jgi:acyl-CoA synthetase (AMP-forming)/AMP-acid ligase II